MQGSSLQPVGEVENTTPTVLKDVPPPTITATPRERGLGHLSDELEAHINGLLDQLKAGTITTIRAADVAHYDLAGDENRHIRKRVLLDLVALGLLRLEGQTYVAGPELQEHNDVQPKRYSQNSTQPAERDADVTADRALSMGSLVREGDSVLSRYEVFFDSDFSGVKLHHDNDAVRRTQALGARAFTKGNDIYFNRGEYSPYSRAGQHLLAHELTHVVQQTRPGATHSIQRQADPAHDLTAPGLSGDPKLEEIFDENGFLGPPRRGAEVEKVQEALLALGFTLPKFGADGDYGSETSQAVRDFQTKAGLSGAQIDGIVGPITLGLLDRASRQGSVTTDTDAAEQDLKVTGKATSKLEDHLNKNGTPKEPVRVFFEFDSDKVASDEKDKLKALHRNSPTRRSR